jgi:hypothetical protein
VAWIAPLALAVETVCSVRDMIAHMRKISLARKNRRTLAFQLEKARVPDSISW